ncbi:dihydrofolate synthase / folylpolyglutamate synthase [Caloramator fervidus]|uniref:Dihydrofolate synthase/folylpolyglutamate synthase n=1 Tax=Caloramator fervidus TaxID=29344 RepID=A0A1H5U9A8_9CLOT|nr:folylpolyglutamate synthase/dihydrofolate synthase family protein [Caloramator fervidus]SEF71610.1 dihydrofolate synthase / folylpolyglutamate synthase [Caloramator fervidus]
MDYKEALEFIENMGKFSINLGLDRIKRICNLMGDPQNDLKVIHIAGTNGKGSTTTFISSILKSQGYRVGIYTSPYIERFTERIKINDEEIKEKEVAEYLEYLIPIIDKVIKEGHEKPTEFEIITAMAFKYFYDNKVDYVVLEVGLGGRLDATNVVNPILSVITTISYDHMNILGDTLGKIAYEKAGIIKQDIPLVLYPQEKEADEVIRKVAKEKNSKIYDVNMFKYKLKENSIDGVVFDVYGYKEYKDVKIRLLGEHQILNCLTSITAVEALRDLKVEIDDYALYKGLEEAIWPGRFEVIKRKPYVILDGGHNLQGISVLVKSIKQYFSGKRILVVVGMLKDKDYVNMVQKLFEISDSFITVPVKSPRALTSNELANLIRFFGKNVFEAYDIKQAINVAFKSDYDVILFCGSLYMIGEARTTLKSINI